MTIQDTEVLALFEQEARERLAALGALLLEVERDGVSDDLVASLFREAHTLKGAANVVGLTRLGAEAHALEDLFDRIRTGEVTVTPQVVDEMLAAVDRLCELTGLDDPAEASADGVVAEESPWGEEPGTGSPVNETAPTAISRRADDTRHETARVAVDRLDDLVRLAGESAAAHLRLAELVRERLHLDPYAVPEMRAMSRLLAELQERALRARMLPLGAAEPALRRAVRDLGRQTGKTVALEFRGADTELDRTVHEQLVDSLVHIVRNAVDHGLEAPAERLAQGKPPEGSIVVHAMQLGPRVVVTVADDGRGVDIDAVRAKAERLGVATAGLDDAAVLDLLFHPGLTTTDAVTDISGRGVGLDAVRSSLARLRGRVDVDSTPGEGSTFRISVPITLTVVRALVVRAGGQRYAVPMSNVLTVLGPDSPMDQVEGRPAVRIGATSVGMSVLGDVLGVETGGEGPIVAITGVHRTHAFCVDGLEGERDVLLKAIPASIPSGDLVVGASAEPDASVMLVLDAESLVDAAASTTAAARPPRRLVDAEVAEARRILVVDDALTVRELQRTILVRAGYAVTTAADGREALERIDDAAPDLVLTDVEMPELDGLSLCREIRRGQRWTNVPIVVLTSRGSDEDRQAGLEAGADAYIVKSAFDEAALLGVVERLLGEAA